MVPSGKRVPSVSGVEGEAEDDFTDEEVLEMIARQRGLNFPPGTR